MKLLTLTLLSFLLVLASCQLRTNKDRSHFHNGKSHVRGHVYVPPPFSPDSLRTAQFTSSEFDLGFIQVGTGKTNETYSIFIPYFKDDYTTKGFNPGDKIQYKLIECTLINEKGHQVSENFSIATDFTLDTLNGQPIASSYRLNRDKLEGTLNLQFVAFDDGESGSFLSTHLPSWVRSKLKSDSVEVWVHKTEVRLLNYETNEPIFGENWITLLTDYRQSDDHSHHDY